MTSWLGSLRAAIAQASTLQEARAAIEALGLGDAVVYAEHELFRPGGREGFFRLTFAPPVPAPDFCRAFGWERAYAVSPDVHQHTWEVCLWERDLQDPYGARIATTMPALGVWTLAPYLKGRPPGDLPRLAAGASPAYDLRIYPAEVASLEARIREV
jgi:hypothetical protein